MKLQTITSHEFANAKYRCAVLPVGTIEAHGTHLPLGTDNIIPDHIAERIEKEFGDDVLVMPGVMYGHTYYLEKWHGSINIPTPVLREYLVSIGREIKRNGIDKILFLNGHGGNDSVLYDVAETLSYEGVTSRIISWWLEYEDEIRHIAPGTGHAGEDETSLVLEASPESVDMAHAHDGPEWPHFCSVSLSQRDKIVPQGVTGNGTKGTREKGKKLFTLITTNILDTMRELMESE